MIRLASIINAFETDLLAQYGSRLNADQRRALAAMKRCRNQASLKMQVRCEDCEHQLFVPHSCSNRHCPHCQHHESEQWLARQRARQLPAEYFLLTFTLPAEFRPLWQANQSVLYDLLMRAAWETVRTFSENDKQLRGTPGAIAVLHTHTRRLTTRMFIWSCRRAPLTSCASVGTPSVRPGPKGAICSATERWPKCSGRRSSPASPKRG